MPNTTKLYEASSLHDRVAYGNDLFDQVYVHWAVSGRRHPVFPYRRLIADYDGLSKWGRRNTEDVIDGFFSENELTQLREYVRRCHGTTLISSAIDLPVALDGKSTCEGPTQQMPSRPGDGKWQLSAEEGYSLSVNVHGGFHVDPNCPSAIQVTGDQTELGVSYLRDAAELLDPRAELFDEHRLEAVARRLGESGLIVTRQTAIVGGDDDLPF